MSGPADMGCTMPTFATPSDMHAHMGKITTLHPVVYNYHGVILDMSAEAIVVETDLFPRGALEFYSAHNLDQLRPDTDPVAAAGYAKYYNSARGGGQGDYRVGITAKIDNVVSALTAFPKTKRGVMTIPPVSVDHTVDADAKCLRELHFQLRERVAPAAEGLPEGTTVSSTTGSASSSGSGVALHCTGFMRAQAASIFPKNIHYIGSIMQLVAGRLGVPVGSYTHIVTQLTNER